MSANEEMLARLDAAAKGHDIPSDITPPGLIIWMKACADAAAAIRALEARVEEEQFHYRKQAEEYRFCRERLMIRSADAEAADGDAVRTCEELCKGVGSVFTYMLAGAASLSKSERYFLDATENCASEIRAAFPQHFKEPK